MKITKTLLASSLATLLATSSFSAMADFDPNPSPEAFTQLCDNTLKTGEQALSGIEQERTPATLDSVFGAMDDMLQGLQATQHAYYFKAVHPNAALRQAATSCTEKFSDFYTRLQMSRPLYERVKGIDLAPLPANDRYMVEKTLLQFRLAGVDKDEATRAKIRTLNQEIEEIGNLFDKTIQEDRRIVETTLEHLKGLPQDFIDTHQPDEKGIVRISTDYPDLFPVMTYSESDTLRHDLRVASRSIGYPANDPVLKKLIEKRHELAQLLGYKNWASYSMADKMMGSPENAHAFLDRINEALKEPVEKEKALRLARLQRIHPEAKVLEVWQASYVEELMRREDYGLDAREVREYFQYDKVRDGIFRLTQDLFGVEIKPWKTATWHDEVEAFEVFENGTLIGRFYMDNHPRENKYQHAAHWTLRTGVTGRQVPVSALAQNLPKGLMEHSDVETFLHEFGHLLHNLFSGNQKWFAVAGMSMEDDFVEAPSQMLEEWVWDYETLKTFATNEKGEPIPQALVGKMNKARDFGLATNTATQIYYANLSLNYYDREPGSFELFPLMKALAATYSPYPYVEGTAFYAGFGHLEGYSSNYYTYQWSLAIATDLFAEFKKKGMRNKEVAKLYRQNILGVGGSKPASAFVADFLGRPFSVDAYINKLRAIQP